MFQLSAAAHQFPSVQLALSEPNGLLAFGGDLSVERLIAAYERGIFPWYAEQDPILWWSPNPRTIITPQSLHVSRSMRRLLRKSNLEVTLNHAFSDVINACANVHEAAGRGVWIHPEMISAYLQLHEHGRAHSVEVWQEKKLVGGMYGVSVGHVFCAESMFHTVTNASKIALITFAQHFFSAGGRCIDVQISNSHTETLGAHNIAREQYLRFLNPSSSRFCSDFWTVRRLKAPINECISGICR
ncbi:leucyl/phenylalanyl-tRNA--protein transferase [Pseudidiomarina woesei]|uniref:Leucyl/phenylalanyl-tRNA--protein transferase n=1 Tax=Pseudidiomarina woesei TaxID=1381080 RepID=A0A0K6GVE6_9GAMM|nr:leucyl/phenylalanyl-tRNA--protein transferase [Pseudidiomarina woesei]CUA82687.1 leucyl/phenylalanyl-tRNA--protein transferase [Pseudidiomarina woesei]